MSQFCLHVRLGLRPDPLFPGTKFGDDVPEIPTGGDRAAILRLLTADQRSVMRIRTLHRAASASLQPTPPLPFTRRVTVEDEIAWLTSNPGKNGGSAIGYHHENHVHKSESR